VHPILGNRQRSLLCLALCVVFGALLAAVVTLVAHAPPGWALAFAEPLAVVLGLQALSLWYMVRVLPPGTTALFRLAGTWLGAGAVTLALWLALALGWDRLLRALGAQLPVSGQLLGVLLFAGSTGLILAVLGQYLLSAFERSREAERSALELAVLAREAELRFLRDQLHPHFLFNSLNSVVALIGSNASAARQMCFRLAEFFRQSLRLNARASIALAEELTLIGTFLEIEQVRLGERLRHRIEIAEGAPALAVPALVLQPLVENAVHHGIAHLVEGGEITILARRTAGRLELTVENPCDPDRPASRGTGLGLKNVRSRIERLFGTRASLEVHDTGDRFRVTMLLPAEVAAEEPAPCVS